MGTGKFTCIKCDYFIFKEVLESGCCWVGTKFFFSYSLRRAEKPCDRPDKRLPRPTIPHLWEFEIETKIWSEIRFLNYLLEENLLYQFNVDSNGILTLLTSDHLMCYDDDFSKRTHTVSLFRIPLKLAFLKNLPYSL